MKKNCKLCRNNTELCDSHAIPDSLFKSIFSSGSGQAILLDGSENKPIRQTQDSWSTEQLCMRCEKKLNESYERYSLKALRGGYGFERTEGGVLFSELNTQTVRHFVAAILWRASVSKHDSYAAVTLPDKFNERIRFSLNTSSEISKRTLSVRGFKLVDNTDGGFSRENLRDCLISPFTRTYLDANNKPTKTICFLFLGYFFEVFVAGAPSSGDYHHEFLGYSKNRYMFPYLEITAIPEVFELMVIAYGKHREGLSTINC
ncbi:hypothetical protein A1OQ_05665 [Enterovibrio norvegicus FF-162]|uniref:hypothetical protein n=1 Tax=Enterovibrio norvegicus TaxID=188144 RepID=UPI000301D2D6|nr:hypothetical protein [Enterovibrio norvegicus]OEE77128.1 hypothetical protein A1OQ_05665 [Enterovibrio norvegicus FF-162]